MMPSTQRARSDRQRFEKIIAGLSEGVILIEPDQTLRWANQAALAMHGVQTIAGLGRNVTEYRDRYQLRYRNNHPLKFGSYPVDRVVAGEEFSDVVVEVALADESEPRWVHRVRSLIITKSDGEPDCLVLILHDATELVSAELRFERAFGANPAPAVICQIGDLRYVKVNRGFLEMTGYTREDVIGRSVYELDVLDGVHHRDQIIERLTAGETIPQMEATLRLPGDGTKLVIVAGQPIEIGDQRCTLFTFMDIEPRRKAESALRKSQEQFAKAFRMAPIPIIAYDRDSLKIIEANDAFIQLTRFQPAELLDYALKESGFWSEADVQTEIEKALKGGGSLRDAELTVRTKRGEMVDCLVSAETVPIHGRDCVLMVFKDITERKRTEQDLVVAIESVMQDASWFSRSIVERLDSLRGSNSANVADAELSDLTPRERDVLALLSDGLSDKEIAARLGVAPNTVRNRVTSLYSKLGLHRRSDAIIWARQKQLRAPRTWAGRPRKLPLRDK